MATVTSRPPGLRGYDARWADATGIALVGPDGSTIMIPAVISGNTSGGFVIESAQNADSVVNGETNTILLTTANIAFPSFIGQDAGPPTGSVGTNSDPLASVDALREQPWAADTSYPEGGVSGAGAATVIGGYDHICNQLAGTIIGGGHHYMPYNVNGHSTIVGGANHRISAGRASIFGGVDNTVAGASNLGGAIFSGRENVIYGASEYSTIVGGQQHELSAGVNAIMLGGFDNSISAITGGVALGGRQNEVATYNYAVAMGFGARTLSSAFWIGAVLTEIGDSQTVVMAVSRRTTNATVANMNDPSGNGIIFEAARKSAFSGRVSVTGIDEATGNIASYEATFTAKWDGTTATIWAGGSSGTTRPLTAVVDEITVAAVPTLAVSSGLLRVQVTGKLTTNIKWSGVIVGAMSSVAA